MASFASQIQALTGYEAKSSAATDSETTDDFAVLAAQWMTDACKEVINIFPSALLDRISNLTAANEDYTDGTGIIHEGKVIGAIRTVSAESTPTFNAGEVYVCRPISNLQSYKYADPDHLEFATPTDPVFYVEPQTDGNAGKVKVLPTSSLAVAKVMEIDYHTFVASGGQEYDITAQSTIPNFPNEAEYIVVIRAAIYAAQYLLANEQDEDLYEPIIESLEKRYKQAIDALQTKKIDAAPKKGGLGGLGKGMDVSKMLQSLKGKK